MMVPVTIAIEITDGEALVTDVASGIYGAGGTIGEAMIDLLNAFREHCEVLSDEAQTGVLSPVLNVQLAYLRRVLE